MGVSQYVGVRLQLEHLRVRHSWLQKAILLLAYAACFTALRAFAAHWATGDFYSLWFPAAGLRFAFLWRAGARLAPAAAVAELIVQLATGQNSLQPDPILALLGITGPCLVYGAVIHLVQRRAHYRDPIIGLAPLPFTLSAIFGPIAACVAALPWAVPRAMQDGPIDTTSLLSSLLVFSLGDMLGVLLVAPPLLWLADRLAGSRAWFANLPSPRILAEVFVGMIAAYALVGAIRSAGFGLLLSPVLLASCWAGLRAGRAGAWICVIITAAFVLPLTEHVTTEAERIRHHLLLACIAAIGFLAGSFAEAQAKALAEIERQNRLLFRAERLKTLRAMSIAVIHEISQPLSTIALEARGLADPDLHKDENSEIRGVAELISRKANDMAEMVRKLRAFGSQSADRSSIISVSKLVAEVKSLADAEARSKRVDIISSGVANATVRGDSIELRQALLNLLRNAVAASPSGAAVEIQCSVKGDRIVISFDNEIAEDPKDRQGMGIGLIIARSIAEAHGGILSERRPSHNRIRFIVDLPLVGASDEQR